MTNKMTCAECADWLHPYFDNELDTQMALHVRHHLDHCPDCAQELA